MVNYWVVFTRQMRTLFCKRLAACLCMKQPTTAASVEFALSSCLDVEIANSNKEDDYLATSFTETMANETTTNRLLKRMCDLLETLVHREQRCEDDEENEKKKDWMLAAAVLDRICASAITVIFVAGTVIIFAVCFIHP